MKNYNVVKKVIALTPTFLNLGNNIMIDRNYKVATSLNPNIKNGELINRLK